MLGNQIVHEVYFQKLVSRKNLALYNIVTFSSHFSSEHLRKPREAVDASKKIIGDIQKINPDKDGVCTCPICPKGNLFINSLFLILF